MSIIYPKGAEQAPKFEPTQQQRGDKMNDTIKVAVRNVYGKDLIYPACSTAQLLASLNSCKTITPDAMEIIKALGYKVETVLPDVVN